MWWSPNPNFASIILGKNINGTIVINNILSIIFVLVKKYPIVAQENAIIPAKAVIKIIAMSKGFVIHTQPIGSAGFEASIPEINNNSGLKKNINGNKAVLIL